MMQNVEKQCKNQSLTAKSVLGMSQGLTYLQLSQLQRSISLLVQQNKSKFSKILTAKPEFSHQLYKIGQFQAFSKAYGKELLLRQMDRLLEQRNYLDRQLSLIKFHDQERDCEKNKMVADQTQQFQLLKSIWKRQGARKYEGTIEHIEELNLMVGQVKANILSLIRFQSNESRDFQDTYLSTFSSLKNQNKECKHCNSLQAKIDFQSTKIQQLEQQASKLSEENILYLQQMNAKDDKIKKTSKMLIKQQTQLKDKIVQLEQQLLKKDQQIRQIKKQSQLDSKFINKKEGFEIIFKSKDFDFSPWKKQINLTLEQIMASISDADSSITIFNNSKIQKRVVQDIIQPQSEMIDSGQIPEISISCAVPSQSCRQDYKRSSKTRDNSTNDCIHLKIEDLQNSSKRYVRTSSKKQHKGSISLQSQDSTNILLGRDTRVRSLLRDEPFK